MLGLTSGGMATRLACEAWTAYQGPRGGSGWQNEAGDVRYTDEMPGEGARGDQRTVATDSPAEPRAAPGTDEPGVRFASATA